MGRTALLRQWVRDRVSYAYCYFFGRKYTAKVCGHTFKKVSRIKVLDETLILTAIGAEKMSYCPKCWASKVIRCAWCGGRIVPGDPITLYAPKSSDIPEHAGRVQLALSPLQEAFMADGPILVNDLGDMSEAKLVIDPGNN